VIIHWCKSYKSYPIFPWFAVHHPPVLQELFRSHITCTMLPHSARPGIWANGNLEKDRFIANPRKDRHVFAGGCIDDVFFIFSSFPSGSVSFWGCYSWKQWYPPFPVTSPRSARLWMEHESLCSAGEHPQSFRIIRCKFRKHQPIGSMYAIYGNIYHQYTPFMLAYIPAPWILCRRPCCPVRWAPCWRWDTKTWLGVVRNWHGEG